MADVMPTGDVSDSTTAHTRTVDRAAVAQALLLLDESARLHEGGFFQAHERAREARAVLAQALGERR